MSAPTKTQEELAAEVFKSEVVLCDRGLPKMDGYEVARRLCQRQSGNIYLIALRHE